MNTDNGGNNTSEAIAKLWGDRIDSGQSSSKTIKENRLSAARGSLLYAKESNLALQSNILRPRRFSEIGSQPSDQVDYCLLDVLGEGGMGEVFNAVQVSIDREIAVKMLKEELSKDQDAVNRFVAEGQVAGKLDHPNIVPIYELGTTDKSRLFMTMKKVRGVDWEATLRKKSIKENLDILLRVCDATAFAHSKNIIHRDLKPENIMLGEFGEVILMDWGISASLSTDNRLGGVTEETAQAGTPAFMPPEVALCQVEKIGIPSDVYLLGGILFEICTSKEPHSGQDIFACLEAAAKNILPETEKKGELINIAFKALSTSPKDRYQSVKEFQFALQHYLFHAESLALSESAKEDLRKAGNDYALLSRALTLSEEAVKLWPENVEASQGVINTRKIYASIALARGDLDLGKSLLSSEIPEHQEILRAIKKAILERNQKALRLKILTYCFIGFVASLFIILLNTQSRLELERDHALAAQQKAETALRVETTARKRLEEVLKKGPNPKSDPPPQN